MDLLIKTLDSLWKVVAVGLLLGAGLPTLFALGLRSLNPAPTAAHATRHVVAGYACFAVVVVAVGAGIAFIVLGGGH